MRNVAKTAFRAVLKRWGSSTVKQKVWDREFALGQWDHLEQPPTDLVYRYLKKYASNGSILDLGCGTGEIGMTLPVDDYRHYTGVDVSSVAMKDAAARSARQPQREPRNEFVISDIAEYVPAKQYDAVLFMEVLCYFRRRQVKGILKRYSRYLSANGVFIAQLWNSARYSAILKLIAKNFNILEQHQPEGSKTMLLVFR